MAQVKWETTHPEASQNYTSIASYGTAEFWDIMASAGHREQKLNLIIQLCLALGLRCPAEPTLKYICSFWLVAGDGAEAAGKMSSVEKVWCICSATIRYGLLTEFVVGHCHG